MASPLTRRSLLAATAAGLAVVAGGRGGAMADECAGRSGLHGLAGCSNRYFGCSVKDSLFTDTAFAALVARECGALVCTYSMKWRFLEPEAGRFDFDKAGRYVDFAARHRMLMRGHTLVWEKDLPPWLPDALARGGVTALERHVRGVAGHYAGRIHSWDVVNEVFEPDHERPDGLKATPFLKALGPSYIEAAFAAAHEADPKARLCCNTNPAPYRTERHRRHFRDAVALLERLVGRGVPIHEVGIQSHFWAARADEFDEATLRWFIESLQALGLGVVVTELDVTDKKLPGDVALRDRRVAESYRMLLDVMLSYPAVKGVLTWGLSDRYTGLDRWPRADGLPVRGLPYDEAMQPKPARLAIAEAFRKSGSCAC
ncbi:MAG TPA: endo-1,4-beta-xylanase [Azospirillum sp.]|nr:endo-1,4-beta-xylanase [Azospirillum sp.]